MLAGVSVLAALVLSHPATLLSQAIERSMYVSVVDQAGAPVPEPGPRRTSSSARTTSRAKSCASSRRPTRCRSPFWSTTAPPPAPHVPNIRRALPAFVEQLRCRPRPAGATKSRSSPSRSRPTILADYSIDAAPLVKAIDRVWEEPSNSGYYLLNGIIEVSQGFKKREATRPVIVAIASEGVRSSAAGTRIRCSTPLRESGATLYVISIGTAVGGVSDDVGLARSGRGRRAAHDGRHAHAAAGQHGTAGKLQQLANVLTHSYRVIYAHPDSLIPPDASRSPPDGPT